MRTRQDRRTLTARAENRKSETRKHATRKSIKADAEGQRRMSEPPVDHSDWDSDGFVPNARERKQVADFLDLSI